MPLLLRMLLFLWQVFDDLNNMEILIYRHDESEESATIFFDVHLAIDYMKQRATQE